MPSRSSSFAPCACHCAESAHSHDGNHVARDCVHGLLARLEGTSDARRLARLDSGVLALGASKGRSVCEDGHAAGAMRARCCVRSSFQFGGARM
eukprot:6192868-Pleurochrysis_carterae.AAC.2